MSRRFVVAERSMAPWLHPGQELDGEPLGEPRRGAVVVFPAPDREDFWLVKRVVGLPGETVALRAGEVLLDGVRYDDPWTVDDTLPEGEWRVPVGYVFVLSDARHRSSADSRSFGPIPVAGAYEAQIAP